VVLQELEQERLPIRERPQIPDHHLLEPGPENRLEPPAAPDEDRHRDRLEPEEPDRDRLEQPFLGHRGVEVLLTRYVPNMTDVAQDGVRVDDARRDPDVLALRNRVPRL